MAKTRETPRIDASKLIAELTDQLVDSYLADERTQHLDSIFLPSRAKCIEIIELLRRLAFPGFFDDHLITTGNVHDHVKSMLAKTHHQLYDQARQALRYDLNAREGGRLGDNCDGCDERAEQLTDDFLRSLPELRRLLALDVMATFEGDPASASTDENIFCYPGIDAIFTHRVAHRLNQLGTPLLPRIMSEYAHNETGVDIHPGATIGESFCIDHGTGIVIGETCVIGDRVKLYQGVTLGALSLRGGHDRWAGVKRHPTIGDDVTIYGGAIILGGDTTIGDGATIGGSVFITSDIPAGHTVTMEKANLKITPPKKRKKPPETP